LFPHAAKLGKSGGTKINPFLLGRSFHWQELWIEHFDDEFRPFWCQTEEMIFVFGREKGVLQDGEGEFGIFRVGIRADASLHPSPPEMLR
jgi:hypothetical protein